MNMKQCAASAIFLAALLLGGCATGLKIDTTYTATSQDSRVQFLIIHFTTVDLPRSLNTLTQGPVSSHYLVSERQGDVPAKVYQLVDENRRAYHAGVSSWKGATALNASSIGIEIVNLGGQKGASAGFDNDARRRWRQLVNRAHKQRVGQAQRRPPTAFVPNALGVAKPHETAGVLVETQLGTQHGSFVRCWL